MRYTNRRLLYLLTDPHDALPHIIALYTKVDAQCDKLATDDRRQYPYFWRYPNYLSAQRMDNLRVFSVPELDPFSRF